MSVRALAAGATIRKPVWLRVWSATARLKPEGEVRNGALQAWQVLHSDKRRSVRDDAYPRNARAPSGYLSVRELRGRDCHRQWPHPAARESPTTQSHLRG